MCYFQQHAVAGILQNERPAKHAAVGNKDLLHQLGRSKRV